MMLVYHDGDFVLLSATQWPFIPPILLQCCLYPLSLDHLLRVLCRSTSLPLILMAEGACLFWLCSQTSLFHLFLICVWRKNYLSLRITWFLDLFENLRDRNVEMKREWWSDAGQRLNNPHPLSLNYISFPFFLKWKWEKQQTRLWA